MATYLKKNKPIKIKTSDKVKKDGTVVKKTTASKGLFNRAVEKTVETNGKTVSTTIRGTKEMKDYLKNRKSSKKDDKNKSVSSENENKPIAEKTASEPKNVSKQTENKTTTTKKSSNSQSNKKSAKKEGEKQKATASPSSNADEKKKEETSKPLTTDSILTYNPSKSQTTKSASSQASKSTSSQPAKKPKEKGKLSKAVQFLTGYDTDKSLKENWRDNKGEILLNTGLAIATGLTGGAAGIVAKGSQYALKGRKIAKRAKALKRIEEGKSVLSKTEQGAKLVSASQKSKKASNTVKAINKYDDKLKGAKKSVNKKLNKANKETSKVMQSKPKGKYKNITSEEKNKILKKAQDLEKKKNKIEDKQIKISDDLKKARDVAKTSGSERHKAAKETLNSARKMKREIRRKAFTPKKGSTSGIKTREGKTSRIRIAREARKDSRELRGKLTGKERREIKNAWAKKNTGKFTQFASKHSGKTAGAYATSVYTTNGIRKMDEKKYGGQKKSKCLTHKK